MNSPRTKLACVVLLLCLTAVSLPAQAGATIELTVDAREAPLKVLHVRESMPVSPGALTLYYPKWIPGLHQPAGPVATSRASVSKPAARPCPGGATCVTRSAAPSSSS